MTQENSWVIFTLVGSNNGKLGNLEVLCRVLHLGDRQDLLVQVAGHGGDAEVVEEHQQQEQLDAGLAGLEDELAQRQLHGWGLWSGQIGQTTDMGLAAGQNITLTCHVHTRKKEQPCISTCTPLSK